MDAYNDTRFKLALQSAISSAKKVLVSGRQRPNPRFLAFPRALSKIYLFSASPHHPLFPSPPPPLLPPYPPSPPPFSGLCS